MKVLCLLSFLPLSGLFVLQRRVIGLWPHVMLLNIAPPVSLTHTNTLQFFCRGSQEGCRVHSNRVALSYLIALHNQTDAYCAFETRNIAPQGLKQLSAVQLICMFILLLVDYLSEDLYAVIRFYTQVFSWFWKSCQQWNGSSSLWT